VQLPVDTTKPELKLDGRIETVPDLPLNLLVSTLRERILQHTGVNLSASKIRISYGHIMLTNGNTIASYNLEDEDLIAFTVRDTKKK
jgi:splicing factor 3A subunit 1